MNIYHHYFLVNWQNLTLKERILAVLALFFLVTFGVGLAIVSWIIGVIAVLIVAGLALLVAVGIFVAMLVQKLLLRMGGKRDMERRW